jgi:hypothetical protein
MIVQFVTNGGQIPETQQEFDEDFEIPATQYHEKDEIQEETLENVNETEIEASQPTIIEKESLSIETCSDPSGCHIVENKVSLVSVEDSNTTNVEQKSVEANSSNMTYIEQEVSRVELESEQEVSRVELEEARPNRESVLFSDTEFSRFELNFEILDAVEYEVEADVESSARSEVPHGLIKSIASFKEFSMEKSHLNNDSFF